MPLFVSVFAFAVTLSVLYCFCICHWFYLCYCFALEVVFAFVMVSVAVIVFAFVIVSVSVIVFELTPALLSQAAALAPAAWATTRPTWSKKLFNIPKHRHFIKWRISQTWYSPNMRWPLQDVLLLLMLHKLRGRHTPAFTLIFICSSLGWVGIQHQELDIRLGY